MRENLVGYLLGGLDHDTHREVETYLRGNAKARAELDLLREALQPLAVDAEAPTPSPGLAARTLARILQPVKTLPRAPRLVAVGPDNVRPFWRRMDCLIAASLLLVAVGLGVQGLYSMRDGTVQCQENLRRFSVGLETYRDMHHKLPDVIAVNAPRPAAGLVVPILVDAGALPPDVNTRCSTDVVSPRPVALNALQNMNRDAFEQHVSNLTSYAYSLGYRDGGLYFGPQSQSEDSAAIPLMADGPPEHIQRGNSSLHRGNGQNVLFHDGRVLFLTSRTPDGLDDIYLNNANRVAAGLHRRDAVLGGSSAQP